MFHIISPIRHISNRSDGVIHLYITLLVTHSLNLELYKARNVMRSPVVTVTPRESVAHLAHLLLETTHGGFPVVKQLEDLRGHEVAYGLLTR